jgi:uncharacterized protein YggE
MQRVLAFLSLFTSLFASTLYAQVATMNQPAPRRIEITGFAELEVTPDQLYFSISLREYFKDEKNQRDKVSISTLEQQLVKAVTDAKLPKEALTIMGVGGAQATWPPRKRPANFLEAKQYELNISRPDMLDVILSQLDPRGVQYAHMSRVDHSQKEALKMQVKIKALKDAKDKATYLLAAIDEQLGQALEIREIEDGLYYPQPIMARSSMKMMAAESADAMAAPSDLEFQKIKLSYRMQAVFSIK